MKQKITQILIGLFFLFGFQNSSAQWSETKKNLDQKSREEFINKYSDRTLKQLSKMISAEEGKVLKSQLDKLVKSNRLINKTNSIITVNNNLILSYKRLIRKENIGNNNAGVIRSHKGEIKKLANKNKFYKRSLTKELKEADRLEVVTSKLRGKMDKLNRPIKYMTKAGLLIKYNDAIDAGFSVSGEIAAWYEGNSSFKNVVLRATREGGKAAVSIGAGALAGSAAAVMSLNPFAAGGAAVLGAVSAEEFYNATIGKSFDRLMDREHDSINKYAADPEKLQKMREENREKAHKKNKKLLKEIGKSQSDYNKVLQDYIEERNRLWAEFAADMQQEEENQLAIEKGQKPSVVQKPSKKKIKPGESVTITVETTGGLLPITYSGALSYVVENGYDRYLISYKWTPEKNIKPGIYDFSIRAKSASGKIGRHTLGVEVIDPNPAPEEIAKEESGGKTYNAKDLNIKEIPGAKTRELIYKVNGIYYGICQTPPATKTQKFEISLGVDPGNIEGKLGLANFSQFAGSKTVPMSEEQKEAVLVKLREKGYMAHLPYPDYLDDFYKIYFHAWGRYKKFDPVTGRIWGDIEGESSIYSNYVAKSDFKGFLEAKLKNGIITGTITFNIANNNYSFPFTAKQ